MRQYHRERASPEDGQAESGERLAVAATGFLAAYVGAFLGGRLQAGPIHTRHPPTGPLISTSVRLRVR